MKKTFICADCGSRNVFWDATAVWDVSAQRMDLGASYDACRCEDCGFTAVNEIEATADDLVEINESSTYGSLDELASEICTIGFTSKPAAERYQNAKGGTLIEGDEVIIWLAHDRAASYEETQAITPSGQ